ncbi:uncharacterized protein LOC143861948 [Tasmannia lanceolata]|uniref:uncharacterized protein LOC143861948 n=1 Tax=Tasmannia lanceolata TaxID=3420 RepID=UPI00406304AD
MTMVPSRNFLQHKQHCTNYGGGGGGSFEGRAGKFELRSDLGFDYMAEEESRTTSSSNQKDRQEQEEEVRDERWLQLGLGSHVNQIEGSSHRGRLIELDLLSEAVRAPTPAYSAEFQAPQPIMYQHQLMSLNPSQRAEIAWGGFRQGQWNPMASSSTPSYQRPFQYPYRTVSALPAVDVAGPSSSDMRVVGVPARPQSGLWFVLQASENQEREPILPQISKSYLRIKDGRMPVRLLMKYLASKLGLNNESEIEITCRGQQLLPSMSLQHVRDNIWCSREEVTLVPDTPTTNHVMLLHYGRSG